MLPARHADDAAFEECLAGFEADVATAIRSYFAMAAINHLAAQDGDLLSALNEAADFWVLIQANNQLSLFMALGRVFDQDQKARSSLDRVVAAARKDRGAAFSAARLTNRKRRESPNADEWLTDFLKEIYVPSKADFRALRRWCDRYRNSFNSKYRPIRNEVYAHRSAVGPMVEKFFADARLVDLRRIIRFLQILGDALWSLYNNGSNPWKRRRFPYENLDRITSAKPRSGYISEQEIIGGATRRVSDKLYRMPRPHEMRKPARIASATSVAVARRPSTDPGRQK